MPVHVADPRVAVDGVAAGRRQEAAAVAWHAEPVVRFFCLTFGDGVAGVRVSEENFIVITAALLRGGPVETTIAVGPEGTCACRIDTAQKHFASTSPDARLFEQILTVRLTGVGVRCRDRDS